MTAAQPRPQVSHQLPHHHESAVPPAPSSAEDSVEAISAAELASLKQKAAAFDVLAPQLDRVSQLAADGWIKINQGETLIVALIREVTLLRAERLPPPINHHFEGVILAAFDVMTETLRLNLHRTEETIQHLRFQAFHKGVETLVTMLVSNGRNQAYNTVQTIVASDIVDAERLLAFLRAPASVTSAKSDADTIAARTKAAERIESQIVFMRRVSEVVGQIISGGLTPDQAAERIKAAREGVTPPAGAVLN